MACWIASESSARPSALPFTVTARESAGVDSIADVEARVVEATIVAAMVDRKRVCILSCGSLLVAGLLWRLITPQAIVESPPGSLAALPRVLVGALMAMVALPRQMVGALAAGLLGAGLRRLGPAGVAGD